MSYCLGPVWSIELGQNRAYGLVDCELGDRECRHVRTKSLNNCWNDRDRRGSTTTMERSQDDREAYTFTARLSWRRALMSAGSGLATSGVGVPCQAAAQEATPASAAPVMADAPGQVTPERVASAVDRIPALAQELLDETGVPGMSVVVVYDEEVLYLGTFGVRELGKPDPVEVDTVFQIASLSKSLAATVVSAVDDDGTVNWDSRMAGVDPTFALREAYPTQQVTLANLFPHRSGLPGHAGDLLEDLGFDRDQVLHRLRFLEPAYSFRQGYCLWQRRRGYPGRTFPRSSSTRRAA